MKKAIILLSGTPSSKMAFEKAAMSVCWLWQVNPKDKLGSRSEEVGWDGVYDDPYKKFLSEYLSLVNKYFGFEEKYIGEKIASFLADKDEIKTDKTGKSFDRFVLVFHGLSRDLYEKLKGDDGAFQLHVTSRSLNTNVENHDYVLYDDDPDFVEKCASTIRILTN